MVGPASFGPLLVLLLTAQAPASAKTDLAQLNRMIEKQILLLITKKPNGESLIPENMIAVLNFETNQNSADQNGGRRGPESEALTAASNLSDDVEIQSQQAHNNFVLAYIAEREKGRTFPEKTVNKLEVVRFMLEQFVNVERKAMLKMHLMRAAMMSKHNMTDFEMNLLELSDMYRASGIKQVRREKPAEIEPLAVDPVVDVYERVLRRVRNDEELENNVRILRINGTEALGDIGTLRQRYPSLKYVEFSSGTHSCDGLQRTVNLLSYHKIGVLLQKIASDGSDYDIVSPASAPVEDYTIAGFGLYAWTLTLIELALCGLQARNFLKFTSERNTWKLLPFSSFPGKTVTQTTL